MPFSLFRKKPGPKHDPIFVYARLNMKVMPIDRGDLFEDPLDEALKKAGLGEVTGGGTLQLGSGEIDYCGVDVDVTDLEQGVPFICKTLTDLGAPKGSRLEYQQGGQDFSVPFGNAEGLAIYLNGTDLPDEVYKTSDVNVVIETINTLLKGQGSAEHFWEGPTETALYLYGLSAQNMQSAIAGFLAQDPLCQRARVVRIA